MFDEALPIEVPEPPSDLARLDVLLSDPGLLALIAPGWGGLGARAGPAEDRDGDVLRLRVIKQRTG